MTWALRRGTAGALSVVLALPAGPAVAQEPEAPPSAARPADVESVEAILAALYDVISGPAGAGRDWERLRSLFIPEAWLIPTWTTPDGESGYRALTVDDWIQGAEAFIAESGFYEREVLRVTERFAGIAHVFSTYESRRGEEDPKPFARGINSIQLRHDGERWWIVNIMWQQETPHSPLPPEYLP